VASPVCSAKFPAGFTVTLTASGPEDVVDAWNGGGCTGTVNINTPYTRPLPPLLIEPPDLTCAVPMTADTSVSATFAAVFRVLNDSPDLVQFVPDPGGPECTGAVTPNCKGKALQTPGGDNTVTDVIPYGATVHVFSGGATIGFSGPACNPANGATDSATECDFTMAPGDVNPDPGQPSLIIEG
jgi:hypothetical protein